MTANDFRKMALALPETEERSHMNHPDFRVAGKIFATLAYPDKTCAMVKAHPRAATLFLKRRTRSLCPHQRRLGTPRRNPRKPESRQERQCPEGDRGRLAQHRPETSAKINMKLSCPSQPSHTHAPLRIRMQEVRSPLRKNPAVLRQDGQEVPRVRRPGRADDLRPRRSVQRLRLVRDRLRQEVLFPRILRQRLLLKRQEGRETEIGQRLERFVVERQRVQRKLLERLVDQREQAFQGNSPQRFRQA